LLWIIRLLLNLLLFLVLYMIENIFLQLCDCPPQPPPLTPKEVVRKYIIFGVKSIIATALIYSTISLGFWGDGKQAEDIYSGLQNLFQSNDNLNVSDFNVKKLQFI
jgi:hypothetical protein